MYYLFINLEIEYTAGLNSSNFWNMKHVEN